MSLHALFLAALAGFALLHWWVLPELESAWSANRSPEKIAKASVIAALKAARTVLQVAAVTYGLLLVAVWLLDVFGIPLTAEGLRSRIELLEKLKAHIAFVSDSILATLAFWSALLGLGYLAYKRHHADLTAQVASRVEAEIERLKTALEAGAWDELPPTAEMAEIGRHIKEVRGYASRTSGEESQRANMVAEALQQKWVQADFFRRMNVAEETPAQPSLWQKLWPSSLVIFTSRGFARDTGALAKACSYAGMVIMCASLVYVAGSGLDAALSDRIVRAWDLAVAADQKEAKAAWEKALEARKADREDSRNQPDAQQAQTLVRAFTRAYFASPAWQTNAEAARRAYTAEAAVVRAHVVAAEGAARQLPVQGSRNPQDVVITATRDAALDPNRPTPLERKLTQKLLKDTSARASGIWQELNTKIVTFTAAYREPAKLSHFAETLLGQVLDPVVDGLQPEVTQASAKQFEKILGKGLKTGLERSIMTQFDLFLANLSGQVPVEAALESVTKAEPRRTALTPREIPEISKLLGNVGQEAERVREAVAKPAFAEAAPSNAETEEIRRLAKTVHEARLRSLQNSGGRTSPPTMDFFATYEDYFANSKASAASTLRAKLLEESGHALKPEVFADAAARARNFEKLGVFNRVGGVLIGRPSTSDAPVLEGYSVRQEADAADRITLVLRAPSGQEIRLGPYASDIIYRALLFAADGRPLVVTILNTQLGAQKVILHPTLVDTIIGCEMIELDKFVFGYIRKDLRDAHSAETQRVEGYDALYTLASRQGARALLKPEFKPQFDALIKEHIESHSAEALQSALNDPLLFSDTNRSPLAARYRIYNGPVLDAMKMCAAKRPDNLDAFGECIADRAKTTTSSKTQADVWFEEPKPLELVSGVRDRPFTLDPDLRFLAPPPKTGDPTLQFLIQDTDGTGNTDVWRFDTLTPSIQQGIKDLVGSNPQAAAILRNSEDFTILQRFFRLAFDGQLRGPQLLSQIAGLATTLGAQVKDKVATPRWSAPESPPGVKHAQAIAAEHKRLTAEPRASAPTLPEARTALTILAACAQAAKSPDRFASPAAWQTYCSFEKVRDKLEASCHAKDRGGDPLICGLANIASFSDTRAAEIKLASLIGISANSAQRSTVPKACRANQ
jgi:hypothetical protein